MAERPTQLVAGEVLKWTVSLVDPDDPTSAIDADSDPSIVIRKGGVATLDSVTVTKRTATTGIYDCQYDPAGEVFSDQFQVEETVTIGGITYPANKWAFLVVNEPNTVAPDNATISTINSLIALVKAKTDLIAGTPAVAGDEMALTTAAIAALDLALVNAADGTDLVSVIADKVAADWVAGDASPLAIVAAILADANFVQLLAESTASKAVADKLNTMLELDGEVYRLTENSVELAPTGSGGGSQAPVIYSPIESVINTGEIKSRAIEVRTGEQKIIPILCFDGDKNPIDMTGKTLVVDIATRTGVYHSTISGASVYGGSSDHEVLCLLPDSLTASKGDYVYSLREPTVGENEKRIVWAYGPLKIIYAAWNPGA